MPYLEMRQASVDPNTAMKYRYTGSHPATAKAVESGAVDAGALDESVYNSMIAPRASLIPTRCVSSTCQSPSWITYG